jgi:hypothetical protein
MVGEPAGREEPPWSYPRGMTASAVANRLLRVWRFTDRYVTLAGRSCCAGRAHVALDKSLARRAPDCAPEPKEEVPRDA